ncbi:MAG: AbrB family transcriptional regulator, partial [Bacillota bacterium]|nr:AbrB family transcriptional regulator [Bacillota bacterium]
MYKFPMNRMNPLNHFVIALSFAFFGGLLFSYVKAPIPWLLGSMTATLIGSRFKKVHLYWPRALREAGLIIVGYSIGLSFTRSAVIQILEKLPSMVFMTICIVLFCACIAYVVSKLTGVDYPTVLTGSIPGGLSQMIVFAEEMKGIDITTVTFLQVARLIMIIFIVPFLVFSPLFNTGKVISTNTLLPYSIQAEHHFFPNIIFFLVVCLVFAFIGKKIKSPTPYLLGPILGTAVLSLSGLHGPALPSTILSLSQFMIGGYIGLLLKPEKLEQKTKIILLALLSGIVMVAGSLGLSMILIHFNHITASTSLLSLAPGGMDQMGIMAHEIHADLSMVT